MIKNNLLLNHNNNKPNKKVDCMWNNSCGKNICCHCCELKTCKDRCIDNFNDCKYKIDNKAELHNRPSILKPVEKKKPGRKKHVKNDNKKVK